MTLADTIVAEIRNAAMEEARASVLANHYAEAGDRDRAQALDRESDFFLGALESSKRILAAMQDVGLTSRAEQSEADGMAVGERMAGRCIERLSHTR